MASMHETALERLCYVCGSLIKKNKHSILQNELLMLGIDEMFGVPIPDVRKNVESCIFPRNLCHPCNLIVKTYFERKDEGKVYKTSKVPLPWTSCVSSCFVCKQYGMKTGGLSAIKTNLPNKYVGRPSVGSMWDIGRIETSTLKYDFLDSPELMELLKERNENFERYRCMFCEKFVNGPLNVICCNKIACYGCVCQYLNRQRFIKDSVCPKCSVPLTYASITVSKYMEDGINSLE